METNNMSIQFNKISYLLTFAAITVFISMPCQAEIYKCVENGKTIFSQYPCSTKSEIYTPITAPTRIPGLNGGTCTVTAVGSDEEEGLFNRYTPNKMCLTSNSAEHVDEACSQWEAFILLADKFTETARDNQNTTKRGTDCDHGAFATCTFNKKNAELMIRYKYPNKGIGLNKMLEKSAASCKNNNGIFSKL